MSQQTNSTHVKGCINRCLSAQILMRVAMFVLLLMFSAARVVRAQNQNNTGQTQNAAPNVNLNNPEDLNDYLNLSDAQKTQIRAIRQQNQPTLTQLQRQQRQASRALNEAIYSGSASDAEIEARSKEYAAAHDAFIRQRSLVDSQVVHVLTPDQRAKLGAAVRKKQLQNQTEQQRQRQERRQQRLEQNQQGAEKTDAANKSPQNSNATANNAPRNNRGNLPRQKIPRPNRVRPRFFVP